MMVNAKEVALKTALAAQGPGAAPIVGVEQFFDGNQDEGSIGCNLSEHPGLDAFRNVLVGLLRRPDIEAVYAQIAEIDPGAGVWPFTDTVFVVGSIAVAELARLFTPLQPDEVAPANEEMVPSRIRETHRDQVLYAWWD
jgi:hypothetical protein